IRQRERSLRRIHANLARNFDHRALAHLLGCRNLREGDQRKCSRYCESKVHSKESATARRVRYRAPSVSPPTAGDPHLAIITSEALITAATLSSTFRPRSSTASFVIEDMIVTPWPRSTSTCAVVAPLWTSVTLPLSWLRALSFINFSVRIGCGLSY